MKLLPILLSSFISLACANVEKVIFLGPSSSVDAALAVRPLKTLTPVDNVIRTELQRVFPSQPGNATQGFSTWFLLSGLAEGQRYELRVCWAAIEPTSFILDAYDLETIQQTPDLFNKLNLGLDQSSEQMQAGSDNSHGANDQQSGSAKHVGNSEASSLLLQVTAAADYFTDDAALMRDPPPVLVDLILDPFVLNAVPHSLLPTASYLVVIAAIMWVVARRTSSMLQSIAGLEHGDNKKRD